MKYLQLLIFLIFGFSAHAQTLKEQAEQAFKNQQWATSAKHYQSLLKTDDADSLMVFNLGYANHQLEKFTDAIEAFEMAKTMGFNPMRVDFYLAKGKTRFNKPSQALEILENSAKKGFWAYGQLLSDKDLEPLRTEPRFKEILKKVESNAFPCLRNKDNLKFDFWIGEWEVYASGRKVGENIITKAQGGCAIHEFYTTVPYGFSGQSINYYDPIDKKWRQNWVGNSGSNVTKFIEIDSKEGMIQFLDNDNRAANGQKIIIRMTFSYLDEFKAVRQFIETSADQGKNWTISFDGLYVKKGAPYPKNYSN